MVVGGRGNHVPVGSGIFPPSDNMTSAGTDVPPTSRAIILYMLLLA